MTVVSRYLPFPWLSALIGVSWLALSHSLAVVHLLSALLLGLIIPQLIRPLLAPQGHRIRVLPALRLLLVVLKDIVLSNITVAKLVLGSMQRPSPLWIKVPLATDHALVNSLFAMIITTTPGTVSSTIDESGRFILVHALDCTDADAAIADMKTRYEAALLEIFAVEQSS